ncbi:MAG: BrnT family toxin [Spirochaetaceae bacterium]|nr:BrnT family toxin [Spirochaetaceae bacterium]
MIPYDEIYKGRFIWNQQKNETNKQKHAVSFECASEVFNKPFAVEEYDSDNSEYEDRYKIIGYIDGLSHITVAFKLRDNLIRIFSARGSNPEEEEAYNENVRRHIGTR